MYEDYSSGQWWFDVQAPVHWGPALAIVGEYHGEDDGQVPDGEPESDDEWSRRPRCTNCNGPNYSLESELCITCRLGMS